MPKNRTRWLSRTVFCLLSLGSAAVLADVRPATAATPAATARATAPAAKAPAAKKKTTASSRRARLARARAAAKARQWREAQTPRYRLDENGALVPDVRAAAAIIYNPETNEILWEENAQDQRSIASITKVMTAAVFLEDSPDLTEKVQIAASDVRYASTTYLRAHETVTLDDLLHLTLIASDNAAARALARVSPYGADGFIDRMNEKALELGLESTHYADPSGLDANNVSSAFDMARLIAFASSDERIANVMRKANHSVRTSRRTVQIHSTNQLVMKGDVDVMGGKTGFIRKAGYCLATLLRLPQSGQQVAVVVLGAQSNAGRFMETRHLFNWLATKADAIIGGAATALQPNEN